MIHGNIRQHGFCYLYEDHVRIYKFVRESDTHVNIRLPINVELLPPGVESPLSKMFEVPYEIRDKRALVVFDGDLPWSALPQGCAQVAEYTLGYLNRKDTNLKKYKDYEQCSPLEATEDGARILLKRRFILLNCGKSLIMRYRQKNIDGWYCMIETSYESDTDRKLIFTCDSR